MQSGWCLEKVKRLRGVEINGLPPNQAIANDMPSSWLEHSEADDVFRASEHLGRSDLFSGTRGAVAVKSI